MDKDKEIQRLQNQVNALAFSLTRTLAIMHQLNQDEVISSKINAEIIALKSLLKTPKNGG